MKINHYKIILNIYIIVMVFLSSCITSPDKDLSLSGNINLKDSDFHNDIAVAIYELESVNNSLSSPVGNAFIRSEFRMDPIENQERINAFPTGDWVELFDHRQQKPLQIAYTDTNGNFKFNNVKSGTYNLVILKDNYSLKYICNLEVIDKQTIISPSPIILLPRISMPQLVTELFVFEANTQYYFSQNTAFIGDVTFESDVLLSIEENRKIDFYGTINIQTIDIQSPIWITSACISILEPETITYFDRININSESSVKLTHLKSTFMTSGINISSSNTIIEHSYFNNNNRAIVVNGGEITINDVVVSNSSNRAIDINANQTIETNKISIFNSLLFNNYIALSASLTELLVHNNYFIENNTAVTVEDYLLTANNNIFHNNNSSIENFGSYAIITYNVFSGNGSDDIIFWESRSRKTADGLVNNNNFLKNNNYYLRMRCLNGLVAVVADIDCTLNYFINNNIENQIWDKHRNPSLIYQFVYEPRASVPF